MPNDPFESGADESTQGANLAQQRALAAKLGLVFPAGYGPAEEVGRGGMGIVYRARDTALDRDVAVKLLRDEFATDGDVAVHFLEEARITAQLQHPNIPPVHAVGKLPNGRPYLVMKLIKGNTLQKLLPKGTGTEADRSRFVTIFEAIAQAVAYAHQRKVIHRDLKPDNVMVGAFGEVQVMDWGLAKVLTGDVGRPKEPDPPKHAPDTYTVIRSLRVPTDGTQAGAGTPAYMSPEQAAEEVGLDPRSDVFSLGAILCCILTGQAPYTGRDTNAIRVKAIRGQTAEALARLDACGADAELVALTKRCLEADASARPADAGAVAKLVADWRTAAEERARQADRESAAKAAAEVARDHAKRLYLLALSAFNQMVFEFQGELKKRAGALELRRKLLTNARTGLQHLVGEAEKYGTPDRALIWSHFQMGDVELALGNTGAALREYRSGRDLAQHLADAHLDDTQAQRDLSVSFNRLGDVVLQLGRTEEARGFYEKGLEVSQRLARVNPDTQAQRDLSLSFNKLGDVVLQLERAEEARGFYEKGLEVRQRVAQAAPDDAQAQRDLSVSFNKLGDAVLRERRTEEARRFYEKGLEVRQRLAQANADDTQAQRDLSLSFNRLGDVLSSLDRTEEAREFYEKDLELARRLARADPDDAQAQRDLSVSFNNLGDVVLKLGRTEEARGFYEKSWEVRQRLAESDPDDAQAQRDLLVSYSRLGKVRHACRDYPGAIESYNTALVVAKRFVRPEFFTDEVKILEELLIACRKQLGGANPEPS